MALDAHYLADYGRVLAAAASQTTDADALLFWTRSAHTTVIVERELHAAHVADFAAILKSPTCTAYTSYLFSLAAGWLGGARRASQRQQLAEHSIHGHCGPRPFRRVWGSHERSCAADAPSLGCTK